MGFKSVFAKVGRGIGIGAKGAWKGFTAFDDVLDRIPFADKLVIAIPVVGPALSFALQKVDLAQEMFPGEGDKRKHKPVEFAFLKCLLKGEQEKHKRNAPVACRPPRRCTWSGLAPSVRAQYSTPL